MVTGRSPRTRTFTCAVATLLSFIPFCSAALCQPVDKLHKREATATNNVYAPFLINNVFNFYGNNGDGCYNRFSANAEGFEFPKGSGKQTTFEDGLLWGGYLKADSLPRVGGSYYQHGIQPGIILTAGTSAANPVAADPTLPEYRVYSVRPDVNPGTPFDAAMETSLNTEEVSLIGRYLPTSAQERYNQYLRDWNEWPADQGAPFRDLNGNGTYEPSVDIPGYPGADQTLFYVANDCDPARVMSLAGSGVIGIQIERTIWGYNRGRPVGNTIFVCTRLVNRSGSTIDSMYIAQWFDPDIGGASDDLVACDTSRSLGFAYNGKPLDDVYGSSPPAVGFVLLQGPMIAATPADTALWQGGLRPGHRNLGMTAFVGYMGSSSLFHDPASGPGGALQWYRNMNGMTADLGQPFVDPTNNQPTPFTFSGDPVNAAGWVDGALVPPGDRRCMLASGPFTMLNGDTQEVVVAHIAAQGADRFSSVSLLRSDLEQIRRVFRDPEHALPPVVDAIVTYPTSTEASVHVKADFAPRHPQSVSAALTSIEGFSIGEFALYDDGLHADGGAGDGVFGSTFTLPRRPSPITVSLSATEEPGIVRAWNSVKTGVVVAGVVVVNQPRLFSDNVNNDGAVNPGENIRYGFNISNETAFPLLNLLVESGDTHFRIPNIAPGADFSFQYNAGDPQSFCSLTLPPAFKSHEEVIPVLLSDANGNSWSGGLAFPVIPLPFTPTYYPQMETGGTAAGAFDLLVVDPARITGHRYVIRGVDSIADDGERGFSLKDSTDGRILFAGHSLPDSLGHNIPVVDGFKILRGSIDLRTGTMKRLSTEQGPMPWTPYHVSNVLGLEGFGGTIGNAFDHWPSGGVGYKDQHTVRLVFSSAEAPASDSLISYAYRYLEHADAPPARPEFAPFIVNPIAGMAYQDYARGMPLAAYDLSKVPPQRLMLGYLENNVPLGFVDGKYVPPPAGAPYDNGSADGPREWFFIFDAPYSDVPDPAFQTDIAANHVPLMWIGYPSGTGPIRSGAQLTIVPFVAPGPSDWWSFALDRKDYLPASYELFQNFPNPFNAGTTIRYTLPDPSTVSLKIYNILGQEVRTLFTGYQYPGEINVQWDGTNNTGHSVVSGVYFYRLEVKNLTNTAGGFVEVNKMVVLR